MSQEEMSVEKRAKLYQEIKNDIIVHERPQLDQFTSINEAEDWKSGDLSELRERKFEYAAEAVTLQREKNLAFTKLTGTAATDVIANSTPVEVSPYQEKKPQDTACARRMRRQRTTLLGEQGYPHCDSYSQDMRQDLKREADSRRALFIRMSKGDAAAREEELVKLCAPLLKECSEGSTEEELNKTLILNMKTEEKRRNMPPAILDRIRGEITTVFDNLRFDSFDEAYSRSHVTELWDKREKFRAFRSLLELNPTYRENLESAEKTRLDALLRLGEVFEESYSRTLLRHGMDGETGEFLPANDPRLAEKPESGSGVVGERFRSEIVEYGAVKSEAQVRVEFEPHYVASGEALLKNIAGGMNWGPKQVERIRPETIGFTSLAARVDYMYVGEARMHIYDNPEQYQAHKEEVDLLYEWLFKTADSRAALEFSENLASITRIRCTSGEVKLPKTKYGELVFKRLADKSQELNGSLQTLQRRLKDLLDAIVFLLKGGTATEMVNLTLQEVHAELANKHTENQQPPED